MEIPTELFTEALREKLASSRRSLEITFHPAAGEGSPQEDPLARLARRIEAASGGAVVALRGDGAGLAALPGLTIAHLGLGKIHYHALPEGPETAPFAEAVLGPSQGAADAGEGWAERLSALDRPVELLVFVGAVCPHCPGAVRSANRIALASPLVTVSIVDVERHAALAERFRVRAVPLTVLDGELALAGVLRPAELVARILARGGEAGERDLLLSLVELGRFEEAAARIRTGAGAARFAALWRGSGTSLRIGLMMAAEEALEADRAALDGLAPRLLEVLSTEDAALRGDTADLLGRIGHPVATDALRALSEDPNPDVAEIASEALEQIRHRSAT